MNELYRIVVANLKGMWAHRWLGIAVAWVIGMLSLVTILNYKDKYEASARVFVNTDSILKPLMTGLTVQPNDEERIGMLSRLVINRPNVERLAKTVGFDALAGSSLERERIYEDIAKSLYIKSIGKSMSQNIYLLSYRDVDPDRAQKSVQALADMFIESSKGGKELDTDVAKRFIDEQIAVYEKKLQEAENRLKEFRVRYLGLTPGEGKDFFVRMSETSAQLKQAQLELREAERARDAFRRGLATEEIAASANSTGAPPGASLLADLDARLDVQRRTLDTLLQRFTESHPDVVGAKRVVKDLEDQRSQLVAANRSSGISALAPATSGPRASETLKVSLAQSEAQVASLSSRVAEFSERYNRLRASAAMMPQLEAEYAQLNRDYEVNKKNYESLVGRRESAAISGDLQATGGVSDIRLVEPPRVSSSPVPPQRRLLVPLGLLLALIAGAAAAWIANEMRPTFFDGRSLRESSGLPLLGVVSLVETDSRRSSGRWTLMRFAGATGGLVVVYLGGYLALRGLFAQLG